MKFRKKKKFSKLLSKPNKKHKRTKKKPDFKHPYSKMTFVKEKNEPEKLLHFCTFLFRAMLSTIYWLISRALILLSMVLMVCLRVMNMFAQQKKKAYKGSELFLKLNNYILLVCIYKNTYVNAYY